MRMRALAAVAITASLLGGCETMGGMFGGEAEAPAGPVAVMSVDRVSVAQSSPTALTVTVTGSARTGGWADVKLVPDAGAADEVVLKLVGVAPAEAATQAITPVTATYTIDPLPETAQKVRVVAETNSLTERAR